MARLVSGEETSEDSFETSIRPDSIDEKKFYIQLWKILS